ncbi:MAG: hypothetical protein NUV80_04870 [Candidatus Berkelbacteria bacterium]|nr:hypothetical protein [Candidatus Berkelbacteria bacterium]MCR4307872.1 hypothetical protein [Candidatus Berkelbacteria bacterium]
MSELLERPDAVEQEPDELERIQEVVVAKFQERGINIDRNRLKVLIAELCYGNLNPEVETETEEDELEYRPDRVFAKLGRNGVVTVDRVEFSKLNEEQKLHHILHEAGHRLDWLISGTDNESWHQASEIISEMAPNEISPYVVHLAEKYKHEPPEKLAKIIRQEAMPDFIAQYVRSDGTFKSFVEQSGLETADLLDNFESMDNQAKETFFIDNPKLENRFHVFVHLREALHNENLMTNITSGWGGDYEGDFPEELALVSWMSEKRPQMPVEQVKKNPPPKPQAGWFDFFWLFRKD